jgi:hypothetical protein
MGKIDKNAPNQEKESFSEAIYKKFKQRPGIYIGSVLVLILVTVTFIGGDMISGGFGRGNQELIFGYYDDVPISWVQGNIFTQFYERALQNYQYQAQMQGRDPNDPAAMAQVWREAYEVTVMYTAVLQTMKKSNYLSPERAVDRAVARLPQFQSNGRFSPALYNGTPEATRLTVWRHQRDQLGIDMYLSDFTGILTSGGEADFVAQMSTPMRSFDMVSFSVDDFPESEYIAYAGENANLFQTIHMSKITVTGEKEAKRILASIKDGTTTFEEAAGIQSQDGYADKGGDMGKRYVFELDWEIPNTKDREVIFSLARGELSDVINIGDAWAFFKINNELTPADLDDTTVMDRVRMYVRNFSRGRMEDWAIAQANEFIQQAKESNFRNAASARSKEVNSFGPLPINYGGIELFVALDSFTIPGFASYFLHEMGRNENFWKTAFKTPVNTPSRHLVQGSNVLVFLPTEETETEPDSVENTARYYSTEWVRFVSERTLQYFFLNNEGKMDDRFEETYRRLFR